MKKQFYQNALAAGFFMGATMWAINTDHLFSQMVWFGPAAFFSLRAIHAGFLEVMSQKGSKV